mmetsp:Transcript_20632/g.69248  ORF Transcript_20632/g.69248 Transcript_20632/m.69248 type:complete len:309 (-) Transcript_20632:315-1241(-)
MTRRHVLRALAWAAALAPLASCGPVPRRVAIRTLTTAAFTAPVAAQLVAPARGEPPAPAAEAPPALSTSDRILAELEGRAEITSVGQPWTRRLLSASPVPEGTVVLPQLPAWLEGSWNVTAKFEGVILPLKRNALSLQTPGVRMASALVLPNVGSEPQGYLQRYGRTPDLPFNTARAVEAYWPGAEVLGVGPAAGPGAFRLTVRSPPKGSEAGTEQRVDLFPVHAAWATTPDGPYLCEAAYRQRNVDAAFDSHYKVLERYSRAGPGRVEVRQRLAAFSHPSEAKYMESGGKAVILYDMGYNLTRTDGL